MARIASGNPEYPALLAQWVFESRPRWWMKKNKAYVTVKLADGTVVFDEIPDNEWLDKYMKSSSFSGLG